MKMYQTPITEACEMLTGTICDTSVTIGVNGDPIGGPGGGTIEAGAPDRGFTLKRL